ncbi:hypothetical protein [Burkholderia contaminans]|uniref:hypothetical protein n=1 Tax=Burkholderia contaminans TaxID=488447 RepID=UPI001CAA265C|nr:hypothetical protein [Burkholderia contaminans]UAC75661.1 hypothetical protein K8B66_32050 [Burkholderia contaminans]
MYKPAICELSLTLDFLSNLRSPLFREKTSGLEMRIGKRNRFTGKRVDVIRGEGSPVGKDFNPMAAKKNTFAHCRPIQCLAEQAKKLIKHSRSLQVLNSSKNPS